MSEDMNLILNLDITVQTVPPSPGANTPALRHAPIVRLWASFLPHVGDGDSFTITRSSIFQLTPEWRQTDYGLDYPEPVT